MRKQYTYLELELALQSSLREVSVNDLYVPSAFIGKEVERGVSEQRSMSKHTKHQ